MFIKNLFEKKRENHQAITLSFPFFIGHFILIFAYILILDMFLLVYSKIMLISNLSFELFHTGQNTDLKILSLSKILNKSSKLLISIQIYPVRI